MAYTDKTRVGLTMKKRAPSIMVVHLNSDVVDEFSAAGNYLVGILPSDSVVTNAYIHTITAADSGVVKLGTSEGGTEILSAGAGTVGKTGTFTGQSATGTGKNVFMSLGSSFTSGDFVAVIEYLEVDKVTKEYTQINS